MAECVNNCDKKCSSHEHNSKTLEDTEKGLTELERNHAITANKLSAIEARLTVFTWISGLLLLSMLTVSLYGVVQLNTFKEVYYRDMLQLQASIQQGRSSK